MSKFLRTLFVCLLVVSLAVTGAMAADELNEVKEIVWGAGNTSIVHPEFEGNTSDKISGDVIDPNTSSLGEQLKFEFFNNVATTDADDFDLVRLSKYAFKLTGVNGMPKAYMTYEGNSHRYFVPESMYTVEWAIETPEGLDVSFDADDFIISGIYPTGSEAADYKFTLTGTPKLTTVGEKYFSLDYVKQAYPKLFTINWSMTLTVTPDNYRIVITPTSADILGKNLFTSMVTSYGSAGIHEIVIESNDYSVRISNDISETYTIAGGTVYNTYTVDPFPGETGVWYGYVNSGDASLATALVRDISAKHLFAYPDSPFLATFEDEESNEFILALGKPITAYESVDVVSDAPVTEEVTLYPVLNASIDSTTPPVYTDVYYEDSAASSALIGNLYVYYDSDKEAWVLEKTYYDGTDTQTVSLYPIVALTDFDPALLAWSDDASMYDDSATGKYGYDVSTPSVYVSYDVVPYYSTGDPAKDGASYVGSSINGFAVQYVLARNDGVGTAATEAYFVYASAPSAYDGIYFPDGLTITAYYDGAYDDNGTTTPVTGLSTLMANYEEVCAFAAALQVSMDMNIADQYDNTVGSAATWTNGPLVSVDYYLIEFVKSKSPAAGTFSRITIPLSKTILDGDNDKNRTHPKVSPEKTVLMWDVLFSGDIEGEDEETTPVTPVIAISGDRVFNNAVIGESYDFVLSYDSELFGYTLSPDSASYVTEGYDDDGNEIITITPPAPGAYTVTVTPYDLDSEDNKGTPVTLTVNVSLPGQLTAAFTPATVTVKAGETATSTLEITNTKTGSPAVKEVSPSADWVTYEPRFINGGAFYEFKFAPAATMTAGTHTFTVTVSDDDKTTSAVVTVNVTAAGSDPTPPTPSTPEAPTATDLSTFQAALVDNTTTSASVVVIAPSDVTVSSWKVYDNGAEVTDTSKVSIQNNLPNQSARITVYPDAFDAGDHTLTARYVTTDSATSNALTLGSFTVADVPVVPVVGKSGGGGCDAGFGALALAAVSLFLLKKRS